MRSSPLALAVLGLLMAGPMHPYGMQRLLRQWGKDQVINVGQRANLYKTIRRLHEAGLIAVRQTERDQLYPERTVYELTEAGQQAAHDWLDDMLAVPRPEYPPFPAALSFAMLAGPDGLRDALERRAAAVGQHLATLDADLEQYSAGLPRVTLLDDEYRRAVLAAELNWIDGLIEALRTGALTWTRDDLAGLATAELAQAGLPPAEPGR
jgi:DNA-binding PadR family transcriptional regulator